MAAHSIRLTFRLGQSGDQDIEAITEKGCTINVETHPSDDGIVTVNAIFTRIDPVDGEGEADKAVPNAGSEIIGIRDRHVIRIGHGDYGCLRVISHHVSPYNWQRINLGIHVQQSLLNNYGNQSTNSILNARNQGVQRS